MADKVEKDPLRRDLEKIRRQHPKLEEQLNQYRERRRAYDRLIPSPPVEPRPAWSTDGRHGA